jgi:hypothetical protein
MASISLEEMKSYLSKTLSSINRNKVNGLLAEIDFRKYVSDLGFSSRVSCGGWIVRSDARGEYDFAQNTAVIFPENIQPDQEYLIGRTLPEPQRGLHTICATFHQIGIKSYYCAGMIDNADTGKKIIWKATELGLPEVQPYLDFPQSIPGFNKRKKRYNFERFHTDTSIIPEYAVPEEFSKEAIRVSFNSHYFAEPSDVDGLFWGKEKTYPVEIKEKTRARDAKIGDYFGLDIGPFVKLAFYAAKKGNLHSMFVVREIDDEQTRNLVAWRFITFDQLAQYASWVFQAGGKSMTGGRSATVKIPANRFKELNAATLNEL